MNSAFYILLFVVVGLPMWYLTTTTYRAALPYDFVDQTFESMQNAQFGINVEVVNFDESIEKPTNLFSTGTVLVNLILGCKICQALNPHFIKDKNDQSQFQIRSSVREPTRIELEAAEKSGSIEGTKMTFFLLNLKSIDQIII